MEQEVNKNQNQADQPNNQNNNKPKEEKMKTAKKQSKETKPETNSGSKNPDSNEPKPDANINNAQNQNAGDKKEKRPRKVPAKKFSRIEKDYENTMKRIHALESENAVLDIKIRDRKDPNVKNEEGEFYKFTKAELAGMRNKRAQNKAEIKFNKYKEKLLGNRYSDASRRNTSASNAKVSRFNRGNRLKGIAKKNIEEILAYTDEYFEKLVKDEAPIINEIKNLLDTHPQKVISTVYKILKKELKDKKFAEESIFNLLSSSPYSRAQIANRLIAKLKKNN